MFERIEITGFRRFEHLVAEPLSRINVLVGTNNAGKTTFLEAVELLAGGASTVTLSASLRRRNELFFESGESETQQHHYEILDASHLFRGHESSGGISLEISGASGNSDGATSSLQVEVCAGTSQMELPLYELGTGAFVLELRYSNGDKSNQLAVPLVGRGGIAIQQQQLSLFTDVEMSKVRFVDGTREATRQLAPLWDRIVGTKEEQYAVETMKILDPSIERIVFTSSRRARGAPYIFTVNRGASVRIPIGSSGEGMQRLLSIALHLASTVGGTLLIDEIDTGLHYTVLEKLWHALVETARRLDIQIFATTHSDDSLEAIACFHEQHPSLASDITVHRLEPKLDETVPYSAAEIAITRGARIEVRG